MLKIYDYGNVHKSDTYSRLYFQDSELDVAKKMIENYWNKRFSEWPELYGDWQELSWKIVKTKKNIKYRLYLRERYNNGRDLHSPWDKPYCLETILVLPNA